MKYNPEIHHRHSLRLQNYDYAQSGAYFITICTQNKEYLFGEIVGMTGQPSLPVAQMVLNELGLIVRNEWLKSAEIRAEIELDEFVVMPNHFHAIVWLHAPANDSAEARPVAPGPKPKSLGALLAGFKSAVTTQINMIRHQPGTPVWQRNYYEHIIRNEESLLRIREYIIANPIYWSQDEMNIGIPVGATGWSARVRE